jgi:hypothetical protein
LFLEGLGCRVDDRFKGTPENARKLLTREFFVV